MVAKPAEVSRSVNVTKCRHAHRVEFDYHFSQGMLNGCFESRTRTEKGKSMRRMMQSLFVVAVLASSAPAQSELSLDAPSDVQIEGCNTCSTPQPLSTGCGNGTGSQLAAYMNSFPTHPNLWASYPAERAKRLDCLYHHLNGCNCEDPKRNLHSQPSTICSKPSGSCESPSCGRGVAILSSKGKSNSLFGVSQLYTQPSSTIQNQPIAITLGKAKPNVQPSAESSTLANPAVPCYVRINR